MPKRRLYTSRLGPCRRRRWLSWRASRRSTPERVAETLEELRKLGLATDSSLGNWRALPLLDVVNQLKAQRLSEIELASVAAESLESHLLAAGATQADDVKILVGRESIVAAHRELLDSARREICAFDKPPYAQARPTSPRRR